jgi:hypothetical protein
VAAKKKPDRENLSGKQRITIPKGATKIERPQLEWWAPKKKGETIAGTLLRSFNGQFGQTFIIECPDGTEIGLPNLVDLTARLSSKDVEFGDFLYIQYEDNQQTRQGKMKIFGVYKVPV